MVRKLVRKKIVKKPATTSSNKGERRISLRSKKNTSGTDMVAMIDADILLYQVTTQFLEERREVDDQFTWWLDGQKAMSEAELRIKQYCVESGADTPVLCFTSTSSWRKAFVMPDYKANRSHKKPLGFMGLLEDLRTMYCIAMHPHLEADDLLGLAATGAFAKSSVITKPEGGTLAVSPLKVVMVSEDKDLATVPGLLYNPRQPERGVISISLWEANLGHMLQTLTGDTTDNYKGCPGCGPIGAAAALASCKVKKDLWPAVVATYEKAKLTEADALMQARVSRIMRKGDFSFTKNSVKLWLPNSA